MTPELTDQQETEAAALIEGAYTATPAQWEEAASSARMLGRVLLLAIPVALALLFWLAGRGRVN